jgi:beta-galactosidase
VQKVPHDAHAEWQIPYEPGKLVAKAYADGKVLATDTVETTGAPDHLVLSPDRATLKADAEDAVVVPVSIADAQGRVVPNANNTVSFQLKGDGQILGIGNGDPSDHDSVRSNHLKAFHGHCMAVLSAGSRPGQLVLTATAPGLKPATSAFQMH